MKLMVIGNIGFDLMAPYLEEQHISTVLISMTDNGFHSRFANKTYLFQNDTQWQPLVVLALKEKVDAVISISGPDQMNLRDGHVKETLERNYGIPVLANPLDAVRIAVNKFKTKVWLRENGFPTTQGEVATTTAEVRTIADRLGYPVVIKLLDHSGGVGLRIIRSRQQIRRVATHDLPLLIEKYVDGPEFSVEVLNHNGRALSLLPVYKGLTCCSGLHPMERVKMAPAPLDPTDSSHLRSLAKKIVTRLNLQPTADVDFVWGFDGPQVLEINPRFGGVTALSMAASGIPVYWALIDMIKGRWHPTLYPINRAYSADLPICADIPPETIDKLLDMDGVFRVKLQKLKKTAARVALKADTVDQLLDSARQAASLCGYGYDSYRELKELVSSNWP